MRYLCIHGHFYQPPRESPWLETIELQDSAYPYHDWNERIMAECYAPNAATRIYDTDHKILKIVNNYASMEWGLRREDRSASSLTSSSNLAASSRSASGKDS